jgi:hypothetical protein
MSLSVVSPGPITQHAKFLKAKQLGEDFSQKLNENFEITSSAVIWHL